MRKNTWYAVYHQQELEYLARSYQPGYFFILMQGGIDLTDYLPIDGSKPMTGALDLTGIVSALTIKGHLIPTVTNTYMLGWKGGVKYWSDLAVVKATIVTSLEMLSVSSVIRTHTDSSYGILLRSYDTAMRTCATLQNGEIALNRAGDIIGLAGKTLDFPLFKVGGVAGVDGTFTTVDGKTVTVSKGIITSIV